MTEPSLNMPFIDCSGCGCLTPEEGKEKGAAGLPRLFVNNAEARGVSWPQQLLLLAAWGCVAPLSSIVPWPAQSEGLACTIWALPAMIASRRASISAR